jgi:outer membrane lipoprotein-sorting protein
MKISDGSASYEVRLDGKDYANPGDIHSTRSMKLIDEYTLEETDKTDRKVSGVSRWVISKDGRFMQVEFSSMKRGQTMRYTAEKQP